MTAKDEHESHRGMLQSTFDLFVDSARTVTQLAAQAGSAGAHAVVPEQALASVEGMLSSLRKVAEQAPAITDELGVLMRELRAKRLTIQAVTAELTVLDEQLEILERTLAPVEVWSGQWGQMQRSLLASLDLSTNPDA